MAIERKIGEIFKNNGIMIKCVKNTDPYSQVECPKKCCFLLPNGDCNRNFKNVGCCAIRSDKTSVYFIEIKEGE